MKLSVFSCLSHAPLSLPWFRRKTADGCGGGPESIFHNSRDSN
jgi:hypothetical protein